MDARINAALATPEDAARHAKTESMLTPRFYTTDFKAMDAMDSFRSKAIDTMGRNNAMMKEQVQRAEQYLDRSRGIKAREAMAQDTQIAGPVAL